MRMSIARRVTDLIGSTPMLELARIEEFESLRCRLIGKLECLNPAGSIKDRVALSMIEAAEADGKLRSGAVIIEPTSGNTGIGLAMAAAVKGYRLVITMPETMSVERRRLMSAYGAELVLTDGAGGMAGAIERALELEREIEGGVVMGQFENPANPAVHEATTGPEIWSDTDGSIDVLVAGIGTGGTISGTGRYLKSQKPDIEVIGVEPGGSPIITEGRKGKHRIEGIGAGFVPDNLDMDVVDRVIAIDDDEAMSTGAMIGRVEGLLVGISSGAALAAALKVARDTAYDGKTIVVILPDGGDRYLSTEMFA